jgi:molybdenum cofactor biosynthesis protein B
MTSSSPEHQRQAADAAGHDPVRCAVLTVSDTRTPKTDRSGPLAEEILSAHGHVTVERAIVRDEPDAIAAQLETWLGDQQIQVILTTGGTGIARRDTTIEVVRKLVAVEIDGFGELFRMLSYRDIAAAAMLSRAVAGLVCRKPDGGGDTFLFAIPGSTDAVRTATADLIAPQLAHLVWHRQ